MHQNKLVLWIRHNFAVSFLSFFLSFFFCLFFLFFIACVWSCASSSFWPSVIFSHLHTIEYIYNNFAKFCTQMSYWIAFEMSVNFECGQNAKRKQNGKRASNHLHHITDSCVSLFFFACKIKLMINYGFCIRLIQFPIEWIVKWKNEQADRSQ